MIASILLLFAVTAMNAGDPNPPGPVIEDCNFLPANHPCHFPPPPPPPELCYDERGVLMDCPPI